jgi:hypothetical protein
MQNFRDRSWAAYFAYEVSDRSAKSDRGPPPRPAPKVQLRSKISPAWTKDRRALRAAYWPGGALAQTIAKPYYATYARRSVFYALGRKPKTGDPAT